MRSEINMYILAAMFCLLLLNFITFCYNHYRNSLNLERIKFLERILNIEVKETQKWH
jgi:hypothetical protein